MSKLSLNNVTFTYFEDRKPVIENLTACFDSSRITILTGASGCGKSTLLYLAAGIYPHHAGKLLEGVVSIMPGSDIELPGIDTDKSSGETHNAPEEISPASLTAPERTRYVAMMFQNPELQFCMDTVENELYFCLENISTDPSAMDALIEEALAFCEIGHLRKRTLHSLSGGERQKVMLACLVLLKPSWLLLDEPFANIDNASAQMIAAKLLELHKLHGIGILAVDHRLENWLEAADDIRVMQDGKLLDTVIPASALDAELLTSLGVIVPGETYPAALPPISDKDLHADPILTMRDLNLYHGKKQILKGLDFSAKPGQIYAIVGESGCGKSSLFGALSGLYRYTGAIRLEDHVYKPGKKKDVGKIGFVTQNPQDQFVADTVRQEIIAGIRNTADCEKRSEEILRDIRLWRYRDISAYLLSQGQQRRLGVAALMAYDCKVLICDEPAYAQDRNNTIAVMDGLCRQARENHIAMIFSSHDRQLAFDYADHVYLMEGGELREIH